LSTESRTRKPSCFTLVKYRFQPPIDTPHVTRYLSPLASLCDKHRVSNDNLTSSNVTLAPAQHPPPSHLPTTYPEISAHISNTQNESPARGGFRGRGSPSRRRATRWLRRRHANVQLSRSRRELLGRCAWCSIWGAASKYVSFSLASLDLSNPFLVSRY
jgi:hypothetical protein